MNGTLVQRLLSERQKVVGTVENIAALAQEQDRDLTSADTELLERAKTRLTEIDSQLNALAVNSQMDDDVKARLSAMSGGLSGEPLQMFRSAGEYVYAKLAADKNKDRDLAAKVELYERATAHETLKGVTGGTADTDGRLDGLMAPAPLLSLFSLIDGRRPFLSRLGTKNLPGGPSFFVPVLNDPHLDDDAGMGVQAKEKDELASAPFSVTQKPITSSVVGGYLNLSLQAELWAPGAYQLVIDQLAVRYARRAEHTVVAKITGTKTKQTLAANASGADTLKAIFQAAATYFDKTQELPDTLVCGPKGWARLGGLVDLADRPLIPTIGAANAIGNGGNASSFSASVAGLNVVVTYAIADDALYVCGVNDGIYNVWEERFGILQVTEPSILGRQIAVAGVVAVDTMVDDAAVALKP